MVSREAETAKARSDFKSCKSRALFDTDAKRFEAYEASTLRLHRSRLELAAYQSLGAVLRTFRERLREVSERCYEKLGQVAANLLETAAANQAALLEMPPESTSLDYAKMLLTAYNTNGETANETALHALKAEAATLI